MYRFDRGHSDILEGGDTMSKLNIKINGIRSLNPVVTLDGKKLKMKTNDFGNCYADVDVADGAELRIVCWDSILSPLWLIWEMISFVLSCFGIFALGRERLLRPVDLTIVLHPGENASALIKLLNGRGAEGPMAELECNFQAEMTENACIDIKTLKRRRTIALLVKIAAWVAIIGTAIAVAANIL